MKKYIVKKQVKIVQKIKIGQYQNETMIVQPKITARHITINQVKIESLFFCRKKKFLIIDGDKKLAYDQLLLCTGKQYKISVPTGADVKQLLTTSEALDIKRRQVSGASSRLQL